MLGSERGSSELVLGSCVWCVRHLQELDVKLGSLVDRLVQDAHACADAKESRLCRCRFYEVVVVFVYCHQLHTTLHRYVGARTGVTTLHGQYSSEK